MNSDNLLAINLTASEYLGFTILMHIMMLEIVKGWFLPFNWWEDYEKKFNRTNTKN